MTGSKILSFLKKYMMLIALVAVVIFFNIATSGRSLYAQNITNLIAQNAYVFVLATGMLLCILTGGNIDLSVGSVVCFVGAVGATLMMNLGVPVWLAIIIMIAIGTAIGAAAAAGILYMLKKRADEDDYAHNARHLPRRRDERDAHLGGRHHVLRLLHDERLGRHLQHCDQRRRR